MIKQAKYLIDDIRYNLMFHASGWDYDDRVKGNSNVAFPEVFEDDASGFGIRATRDFQAQNSGNLVLEMLYEASNTADGAYIGMFSETDSAVFEIVTKNGHFFFNGNDTCLSCSVGETRLKVKINLDGKTAAFSLDGKTSGVYELYEFKNASKLVIGTTGETDIAFRPMKNKLYIDYIVNENFLGTEKYFPEPWEISGGFVIAPHKKPDSKMNYSYAKVCAKNGERHKAYLPFEKTKGNFSAEGYILLPEGADNACFALTLADKKGIGVYSKDNCWYTLDGTLLRAFTSNVWQHIRFEIVDNCVTYKICGKVCGRTQIESGEFDGVELSLKAEAEVEFSFCDIVLQYIIDYPDYCPEPKVVKHPEYEVGMNICNMWREGHHFGWDRITHFTDNTPLMGPYDEGITEVADWEIKFMTEHGVTFQHFCWYCPDPMIDTPIKRSRMDDALRDGYMNARYSDKMKFIIMWENAGYVNPNPDHFIEYIWKYWCEYFFTDSRYLIVENKPVVTFYCTKYANLWGEEKTREIIAFMNEDIKRLGFDGVLILCTFSGSYENSSKYADITYSYHFGSEGYRKIHQKHVVDLANDCHDNKGMPPYMQTVSVGFNPVAWHGPRHRNPMITTDDFEDCLRYVKKRADDRDEKMWYDKLFMMSTWNEYGEGTYIMPSGLNGFGYLDKIRKVFVDENGENENLLPDENQKKRLTYLTVPGRAMIRRLGFEEPEDIYTPNVEVVKRDAKYLEKLGVPTSLDFVLCDNSIKLTPKSKTLEHYDLDFVDETNGVFVAEDGEYIRVVVKSKEYCKLRFAFLTDTDTKWNDKKTCPFFYVDGGDEEFVYYFKAGSLATWKGKITHFRMDSFFRDSYEIISITQMKFNGDSSHYGVVVNDNQCKFDLYPKLLDGNVIVSLDPGLGIIRQLKLYQSYRADTKQWTVASKNVKIIFTIDSKTAFVNGKEIKLSVLVTMRDGLPTLALNELCDILGYKYTVDNEKISIQA